MVIESAQLAITPGREVEFEEAMVRGRQILEEAPGSGTVVVARGVEDPSTFVLLVEWESVEVHQAAMEDPAFLEFRDLVRSFYAGPAKVQHSAPVAQ
jgi:heme-degrading monooxygenase HmoA